MKYQVINVIAKRARQINDGERPVVEAEGLDPLRAAMAELEADKLRVSDLAPEKPEDILEEE
ncbi:DNA-directed RNA polymerase subunit omega [Candidatus Sumerlaeota bacterium]|nr:DNA-directed RNA polymerase subunit omega [Candidatus Sumerlaeota bacterium]